MFSTVKVAHIAHLVGLKLFTAKAAVGFGMIAGTAATGYVVNENIHDDYIDRAMLLIDHAAGGSGAIGAALMNTGAPPPAGTRAVTNPAAASAGPLPRVTRPSLPAKTLSILHDVIIGKDTTVAPGDDDTGAPRPPSAGD